MEMPLAPDLTTFLISWPGGSWQATLRFLVAAVVTYAFAVWLAMIWWTFRDSRERTRDPFYQVLAVFLVVLFNVAGLIIWLMMRPRRTLAEEYASTLEEEALLQELEDLKACPTCNRRVTDEFIVCPACQSQLKEPCARCAKPLNYSWTACPYCALPRRAAVAPPQRRSIARAADESATEALPRGRTSAAPPAPSAAEPSPPPAATSEDEPTSIAGRR